MTTSDDAVASRRDEKGFAWRGDEHSGVPELVLAVAIGVAAFLLSAPDVATRVAVVAFCALGAASGRWPLVAGGMVAVATIANRMSGIDIEYGYLIFLVVVQAIGTTGRRAAAVVAVLAGVILWYSTDLEPTAALWDAVVTGLILTGAAGIGLLRSIASGHRQRAASVVAKADEDRRRLARDLHDKVAQDLSAIVGLADRAARSDSDAASARATLQEIAQTGRESVQEMRVALAMLRATGTDDGLARGSDEPVHISTRDGLEHAVSRSTNRLRDAGFVVEARIGAIPSNLQRLIDDGLGSCLYELVSNVIRHGAPGTTCTIDIQSEAGQVELTVVNAYTDRSVDASTTPFGLQGVRERVQTMNGHATLGSLGSQHWRAHIRVPLDQGQ